VTQVYAIHLEEGYNAMRAAARTAAYEDGFGVRVSRVAQSVAEWLAGELLLRLLRVFASVLGRAEKSAGNDHKLEREHR
jgi:hypothetical protein